MGIEDTPNGQPDLNQIISEILDDPESPDILKVLINIALDPKATEKDILNFCKNYLQQDALKLLSLMETTSDIDVVDYIIGSIIAVSNERIEMNDVEVTLLSDIRIEIQAVFKSLSAVDQKTISLAANISQFNGNINLARIAFALSAWAVMDLANSAVNGFPKVFDLVICIGSSFGFVHSMYKNKKMNSTPTYNQNGYGQMEYSELIQTYINEVVDMNKAVDPALANEIIKRIDAKYNTQSQTLNILKDYLKTLVMNGAAANMQTAALIRSTQNGLWSETLLLTMIGYSAASLIANIQFDKMLVGAMGLSTYALYLIFLKRAQNNLK